MSLEDFEQQFNLGKIALERGQYRQSISHLKNAIDLVSPTSKKGGEAQIWLVAAYQANGMLEEAIALGQDLISHPSFTVKKQATDLLYIMKAPRLERPKEWLTEIPDLSQMSESETKILPKKPSVKPVKKPREEIDLSQVNTEDNQFVWVGLIGILVIFVTIFFLK
jgi:tetratricopeptide (TPR) repeat protein